MSECGLCFSRNSSVHIYRLPTVRGWKLLLIHSTSHQAAALRPSTEQNRPFPSVYAELQVTMTQMRLHTLPQFWLNTAQADSGSNNGTHWNEPRQQLAIILLDKG